MTNTLDVSQRNESLEALSFTLQRQDSQSKALQQVITEIIGVKNEMIEIRDDIKADINKMNDRIFMDESECLNVQKLVYDKATEFTKMYFDGEVVSSNLFIAKMGQIRGAIWRKLKREFAVRKYIQIKHKDYEKAVAFIRSIKITDFEKYETRMTESQLKLL